MPTFERKPYKPLPKNVTIKMSPIEGLGLFATDHIPEGTDLGTVLIPDGMDFIRTPLGGFGNHSNNPNCEKIWDRGVWKIVTSRDIEPDEEITWSYTLYNPLTPIVP